MTQIVNGRHDQQYTAYQPDQALTKALKPLSLRDRALADIKRMMRIAKILKLTLLSLDEPRSVDLLILNLHNRWLATSRYRDALWIYPWQVIALRRRLDRT